MTHEEIRAAIEALRNNTATPAEILPVLEYCFAEMQRPWQNLEAEVQHRYRLIIEENVRLNGQLRELRGEV